MSQEVADTVNKWLHSLIDAEPCEYGCTHFGPDSWSLLGVANVIGRHCNA